MIEQSIRHIKFEVFEVTAPFIAWSTLLESVDSLNRIYIYIYIYIYMYLKNWISLNVFKKISTLDVLLGRNVKLISFIPI